LRTATKPYILNPVAEPYKPQNPKTPKPQNPVIN
jgi:hypothetical protein